MLKILWIYAINKLRNSDGNIQKMFTPPKSKDPWTAMTKGSTGGWAKSFAKPATLLPSAAALAAIPFTGGISAGFLPAVLGSAGLGIGALQGATTGLWGKPGAGSALKGGLMGAGQGAGVGGIGQMFGAGGAATTPGISSAKGLSALDAYSYNPSGTYGGMTNYAQNFANSTGGGISSAFNPYVTGAASSIGGGAGSAVGSGINWGQVAGGLATSLAPSLWSEKTQIPESALYGDITSKLLGGKGVSELGALGREKLKGSLTEPFSPVPDEYYNAATRRLDEAYDKAERDFATNYQGIRPGSNVENDAAYQQGINKLRQDRAREKAGLAAELDYRREADYYDRQFNNVKTAIGVDDQTMQDYMALAQLDAERLALNTGISLGEAQQFKDIFGNLGGYFMQRGLGLNDPTAALQNLMQRMGR